MCRYMAVASCLALAAGLTHGQQLTQSRYTPPAHCGVSHDTFLPNRTIEAVNGRLFIATVVTSNPTGQRIEREDAAARYGATGAGQSTVAVRVPGLFAFDHQGYVANIDPWQPVVAGNVSPYSNPFSNAHRKLASKVEAARQQWLKDNNFVGGVRTFMNDAVTAPALLSASPAEDIHEGAQSPNISHGPKPRAVIELAPDAPRLRSKMRVQASPARVLPRETANVSSRVPGHDGVPSVQSQSSQANHRRAGRHVISVVTPPVPAAKAASTTPSTPNLPDTRTSGARASTASSSVPAPLSDGT
jgi:hypothetical protein